MTRNKLAKLAIGNGCDYVEEQTPSGGWYMELFAPSGKRFGDTHSFVGDVFAGGSRDSARDELAARMLNTEIVACDAGCECQSRE